jgi:TOMM system kinase/cyclase fusion protein
MPNRDLAPEGLNRRVEPRIADAAPPGSPTADEKNERAAALIPGAEGDHLRGRGGRYRIESQIDAGGFGDVFRAVQESTGQLVAVKVLRPRHGKNAPSLERQVARFQREMKVCAELHHAHIVRLIDSGETEAGVLFSVFEFVPGVTLADFLRERGGMTVRMTIELMSQVLDALICAHGKGIVHRDLKPQNIMVSTTGSRPQTTVLDFGISAFVEGALLDEYKSLTLTREILGTPAYAAPEQLRGATASVKSDLYAWGLIFAECLLGRRVFDSPTPLEMVHNQLSSDPVPLPAQLQAHWLGNILRWVLEKDVARRAGDALAVLERLGDERGFEGLVDQHGFLAPVHAKPAGDPRRAGGPRVDKPSSVSTPGERRQLTALCCSVRAARSEGIAQAEAIDRTLDEAQAMCGEIAARFGGHPAGNLGGQLLVYFGIPQASDVDARRSAIVALEIAQEIGRRNAGAWEAAIEVRVGIHTGMVTVSTNAGAISPTLSGVTPELAAQLTREAEANSVLVSGETFLHLAHSFDLQDAGTIAGRKSYRLLGETASESARQPGTAAERTPLIGRTAELAILGSAWERATAGKGSTVTVMAEAGVGKSRLLREFRAQLDGRGFGWLEARCLPEMQHSPLQPILELIAHELNLLPATSPEAAERLESALAELDVTRSDAMPLLCPWFGLALPPHRSPLPFSPQKQKDLLIELLLTLVTLIIERREAPLLIEDLHWADPTTLEFVDRLMRALVGRRSLLLLSLRPELDVVWPEGLVEAVQLPSLEPREVAEMVAGLTAHAPLATRALEDVIRRSDGVPLFIEEIVRFFADHADRGVPGVAASIPSRLRDLLTGRLDRLGPAKATAQIAAAIGREFDYRLLAHVVSTEEASLLADLDQMVSAELLVRRRRVDGQIYFFRHALIRDAAYESMLGPTRRAVHARVAAALEAPGVGVAETRPELLARHWAAAAEPERAIEYSKRAMRSALGKCLYREAAAYGDEALISCGTIADGKRRQEVELELIGLLAPALMASSGWGSEEVRRYLERAEHLSQRVSAHSSTQYAMSWLLLMYHNIRANWDRFDEVKTHALAVAATTGDAVLESVVHSITAQTLIIRGRLGEAVTESEAALRLYDADKHANHRQHFGQDIQVFTLGGMGMLFALLGQIRRALEVGNQALEWAQKLRNPYNECVARAYLAGTWHYLGNRVQTGLVAEKLLADSETYGIADWPPIAKILGGWAAQVIEEPEEWTQKILAIGNRYAGPYWEFTIAQTEYGKGMFRASLVRIERALAQSFELGVHYYVDELYRLRGNCLAALAEADSTAAATLVAEAERAFEEGIVWAQRQEARLPELRATLGLYQLLRRHAPERADGAALARLVLWFGDDNDWDGSELREAKSLLEGAGPLAERGGNHEND